MCNKVHSMGAKCTQHMVYDLFDQEDDDRTECSFIESLHFGTYDETGQLSLDGWMSNSFEHTTTSQKILLGASIFVCTCFIIYACYLHHAMTNLLIKSLSHRELLPPSRHSNRRSPSKRGVRRGRKVGDEDGILLDDQ